MTDLVTRMLTVPASLGTLNFIGTSGGAAAQTVQVTGVVGVPSDATAVILVAMLDTNFTNASLAVWASGETRPSGYWSLQTYSIPFTASVISALGDGGDIDVLPGVNWPSVSTLGSGANADVTLWVVGYMKPFSLDGRSFCVTVDS